MIKAIAGLPAHYRARVLATLRIRGSQSSQGHFVRYSFRELADLAGILADPTLSPEGVERFLDGLNDAEYDLLLTMQKKDIPESLSDSVRASNNKTRLAVRRIVERLQREDGVRETASMV